MAAFFENCRCERWLVKPLACPRPVRYCPDCGVARSYVCSERFRINAHKKSIDVWLKYRCGECCDLWKLPIIERRPIASLDGALYESFASHEQALVWKYAFDVARLRAHVMRVDTDIEFVVERHAADGATFAADSLSECELCVEFAMPFVCDIRLDRLLARELDVTRSCVQRWHEAGVLKIQSARADALGKPVTNGQRVLFLRRCLPVTQLIRSPVPGAGSGG